MEPTETTLYGSVGGMPFFEALVDRFYDGVERDEVLRPLYPDDLDPPRRHLALFLAQYWGGPGDYSDLRGHPRLRMRHATFVVGDVERDRWLVHMRAAVARLEPPEDVGTALEDYFVYAADAMRNA